VARNYGEVETKKTSAGRLLRPAFTIVIALAVALTASPLGSARSAGPQYQVFIPLAAGPGSAAAPAETGPQMPGMGVAGLQYPDLLNADWHYAYEWCGFNTPGCTPMVKYWEAPDLCPPVLLVGNEPDGVPEAGGAPMSPTAAAERSRAIRAMCSRAQTYLIVGNVIQGNIQWTRDYLNAGGVYDALGVHCYAYGTADNCITTLGDFKQAFAPAPICVTEWNLLTTQIKTDEFTRLMNYIRDLTPCSAVFSDINQGLYWSWNPIYWLVEQGGALNPRGQIFANR
jgi:hypothetical protein